MAGTVDTENIQKVFWINIINIMCMYAPASLTQNSKKTLKFWRKPHSLNKICFYWFTFVPTKKAKDERNTSVKAHIHRPKLDI